MTRTNKIFELTQLAEASYANFVDTNTDSILSLDQIIKALIASGFSQDLNDANHQTSAQAEDFLRNWQVINQQPNTTNGFSATLFEDKNQLGHYTLTIRGTEMPGDIINDLLSADVNGIVISGAAFNQIIDLYNYWQRLTTPTNAHYLQASFVTTTTMPTGGYISSFQVRDTLYFVGIQFTPSTDFGLGKLSPIDIVDVAGHSLGGHLSMAFARLFPNNVDQVVTANGAGFHGAYLDSFFNLLAGHTTSFSAADSHTANLFGEKGPELITNDYLYNQHGERGAVAIESASHSVSLMTDTLAVFDLLFQADADLASQSPQNALAELKPLFEATSNDASVSLENLVNALSDLLGTGVRISSALNDDRESLYLAVNALKAVIPQGKLTVISLSDVDYHGKVQQDTAEGLAYRYALKQLNPFVILGADYSSHNASGELDLYDAASGEGEISLQWLTDRAQMLAQILLRNTADSIMVVGGGHNETYQDMETDQLFSTADVSHIDPGLPPDSKHIIFGDANANSDILGGTKVDHLYGGGGNDTLTGNDDNDYLEGGQDDDTLDGGKGNDSLFGGQGIDTYIYRTGDGFDTLFDSDGLGKILWDALEIRGSDAVDVAPAQFKPLNLDVFSDEAGSIAPWRQLNSTVWQDETHHITYSLKTQADGSQTLFINKMGDTLRIDRWVSGDLGITLGSGTVIATATHLYNGDQHAPVSGNAYDWSSTHWATDGTLIGGLAEANFNDVIYATDADETINGLGGNDALDGGVGKDTLDGGMGNDLIAGGAGSDTIYGGAGNDEILSATGLSVPQRIGPNESWQTPIGKTLWIKGSNWGVTTDANSIHSIYGGGTLLQDSAPDIIFAGDGDDRVIGGLGDDYMDGGLNNDGLSGHGGNDIIDGDDGDDVLQGDGNVSPGTYQSVPGVSHGNDFLDGGAGADTLLGGGKNDWLLGGTGNDFLWGDDQNETKLAGIYHGNDYLEGGDGNDQLVGGGKDDILLGGIGDDLLWGDARLTTDLGAQYHGNDYLDGGDGNDQLVGGGSNDTLLGGIGMDLLVGESGDDSLDGGANNDIIDGGEGNDTLKGGAGADILQGGAGDDSYLDLTAEDSVNDIQGNNLIRLNQASSLATDNALSKGDPYGVNLKLALGNGETLTFNNALFGMNATLVFAGGAVMDLETLVGNQLAAAVTLQLGANGGRLYGGAAGDTLTGSGIADVLSGHKGDDRLQAGQGDDVYEYALGDGKDEIIETGGTNDVLRFKAGVMPEDLKLLRSWSTDGEDGLKLEFPRLAGQTWPDYVHIQNYFLLANGTNRIEHIEFADGTTWGYADIQHKLLNPTEGNDTNITALQGFAENDVIDGLGGNDAINGKAGDDILLGGDGADDIQGGLGNDQLFGGAGNDKLFGYGFWLSDTYIVNNDTGNDVLDGGAGDDSLFGGQGNDIYLFGRGDGYDLIGETANASGSSADKLRMEAGILPEDVTLHRIYDNTGYGDDLLVAIVGTNTQVLLDGYFSTGDNSIERIEFDNGNGPVWTKADIASRVEVGTQNSLTGTAADDTFVVDHEKDSITEAVNSGIDTVLTSRSFTLSANIENLTLTGYLNINAEGNDLNNTLRGNVGDNVITGGNGLDIGYGGLGNDQYYSIEDIVEYAGEGVDTWIKAYGGTLPDNVENLYMHGIPSYGSGKAIGNDLDNILTSPGNGTFNNVLDGRGGADTLVIKGWDSVAVYIDNPGDNIIAERQGPYEIRSYIDYVLSAPARYAANNQYIQDSVANRLVLLGENAISGIGNVLDNLLDGSQNQSANTLAGHQGNDRYVIGTEDAVIELPGEGFDTVEIVSAIPFTYQMEGKNVERVSIIGNGRGTIEGTGSDDVIETHPGGVLIGGQGNDTLKAGHDATLIGGLGDDTYYLQSTLPLVITENLDEGTDRIFFSASGTYVMQTNIEEAYVTGTAVNVNITGNNLNNHIEGDSGRNKINGDIGADLMIGKTGSDWYVVNDVGDQVIDKLSSWADDGALDQVDSSVDFNLPDFVENLNLTGSANVNGSGNSLDNILSGNNGNNTLIGLAGNDQLSGGLGDDTLEGGVGNDRYYYSGIGYGQDIVDDRDGNVGDIDTLTISALPTSVVVRQLGSNIVLSLNASDQVIIPWNTVTGVGIEFVQFSDGTRWDAATLLEKSANHQPNLITPILDQETSIGSTFSYTVPANTFTDPDVDDTLSFSATLADDNLLPNWLNFDTITRTFSGAPTSSGVISIKLTATDTGALATYDIFDLTIIGNLILTGTTSADTLIGGSGDDTLSGYAGNDTLYGNAGHDFLDGGIGADKMLGGAGNDTYVVEKTTDVVTENLDEGTDTIESSVTFTLGSNVENLILTGIAAINATGNSLSNALTGNSAANTLSGGTGADTLIGSAGNDIYVVDNALDIVTENLNEGIDRIQSSVTYTAAANIENLALTGTKAINAIGNELGNVLTGNSAVNTLTGAAGNDRLDGKAGADKMLGGAGNDTYVIDTATDVITENANEGIDTVETGLTYTLGANVENLMITGTSARNATGNGLDNRLVGNSAANTLSGGAGNDVLTGGAGADSFIFNTVLNANLNLDTLTDFSVVDDTIKLENAIFTRFTTTGALAANQFVSAPNAMALDSNDYLIYDSNNGRLYYDADGNAAGAQIAFAALTNMSSISAADIWIF